MSTDDTTAALNRIADALELAALIEAREVYKNDTLTFTKWALMEEKGSTQEEELMDYAQNNHRRADHVQKRIDTLTGYREEK